MPREIHKHRLNLKGERFGRLRVIKWLSTKGLWKCHCDCGALMVTATTSQLMATTRKQRRGCGKLSCGCLRRERAAEIGRRHKADASMFRQLREQGTTYAGIAFLLGCAVSTAFRLVNRDGKVRMSRKLAS